METKVLNADFREDIYRDSLGRQELIKLVGKDPAQIILLYLDYRKPFHRELLFASIPRRINLDIKYSYPLSQTAILLRLRGMDTNWWNRPNVMRDREILNAMLWHNALAVKIDLNKLMKDLAVQIEENRYTTLGPTKFNTKRLWPQEFGSQIPPLKQAPAISSIRIDEIVTELNNLSPWLSVTNIVGIPPRKPRRRRSPIRNLLRF